MKIAMHENKKIRYLPYLIILHEIAVYLSNDMYLPSMPAIAKSLQLTQEQTQSTLTLWFLGASALQFILGPISDRYGRKIVIIFGGVCYIISSAVCATATTLPLLLIARFGQGTAVCSILVAGYAAIHELYKTKEAIKILAVMAAVTILAPAFGPLIGALLIQYYDWRYLFWLLFALGIITTTLLLLFMPESNNTKHDINPAKIGKDYFTILTNLHFILPTLGYCLLFGIYYLWMFEAPFLMIDIYAYSPLYYGISQALIFSGFFFGAEIIKRMLQKYSLKAMIRYGAMISLLLCVILTIAAKLFDNMIFSVLCLMGISTATSVLFGPLNRLAIDACKQPMGRRTAVFSTIVSLFGAFSGWILVLIKVESLIAISLLISVCMASALALILFTKVPLLEDDPKP